MRVENLEGARRLFAEKGAPLISGNWQDTRLRAAFAKPSSERDQAVRTAVTQIMSHTTGMERKDRNAIYDGFGILSD